MFFLKIAITVISLSFGPSKTPNFQQVGVGSTAVHKAKSWKGSTGDLSVDLKLEQFGDSVSARGTYTLAAKRRVGCGGESLPLTGTFTLRAKGTLASFKGRFTFDAGWLPPVTGRRTGPGKIRVDIMSVDRGKCVLSLLHT